MIPNSSRIMVCTQIFVLLISAGFSVSIALVNEKEYDSPKPARDRFRIIQSNVDEETLIDEIEAFTAYSHEKMVVIRNKANDDLKLSCHSMHDYPKTATVQKGNAYGFTFRPQKSGKTKFWCEIEYKQALARFDVYNENLSYMCPRDVDEVYQYSVHHDGIYVDSKDKDRKIRALYKGHNKFILWEEFKNNQTDGMLVSALVDGGMCHDIPEVFNDKAAAVTVCYNHCIYLYENYECTGNVQMVEASNNCHDAVLSKELAGKLSAVKGC